VYDDRKGPIQDHFVLLSCDSITNMSQQCSGCSSAAQVCVRAHLKGCFVGFDALLFKPALGQRTTREFVLP
jgi:hypothetical protein